MLDRATTAVLMVEDNPADAHLAKEALKRGDIPIHLDVVEDGEACLAFLGGEGRYAGRARPDLILLDLNLPGLDGRDVLEALKSDMRYKHIPVIVMTTSASEDDVEQCYALRANGYVTKPLGLAAVGSAFQAMYDFWFSVAKLPRATV